MRRRMPFSTDTTWPQSLLTIFNIWKHGGYGNRYYGPYNHLLNYCFHEFPDRYFVAPHNPPGNSTPHDTVNFVVSQVVPGAEYGPVLFVEVKNDGWANEAHLRCSADSKIRDRFRSMLRNGHPLPDRLWGLSLLGTSLCVYHVTVATEDVEPKLVHPLASSSLPLPPDFLEGRWKMDILSQEGFDAMKLVMSDIYNSAAADSDSQ